MAAGAQSDFVGTLEDRTPARLDLDHISAPVRDPFERSWRGFNLFPKEERIVLLAILRGEFTINGLSVDICLPPLERREKSAIDRFCPPRIGKIFDASGLQRALGESTL